MWYFKRDRRQIDRIKVEDIKSKNKREDKSWREKHPKNYTLREGFKRHTMWRMAPKVTMYGVWYQI